MGLQRVGHNWATSLVTAAAKSLQSCPTLCDPIDGSPLGASVPGILQARTLEWVAISFSNSLVTTSGLLKFFLGGEVGYWILMDKPSFGFKWKINGRMVFSDNWSFEQKHLEKRGMKKKICKPLHKLASYVVNCFSFHTTFWTLMEVKKRIYSVKLNAQFPF